MGNDDMREIEEEEGSLWGELIWVLGWRFLSNIWWVGEFECKYRENVLCGSNESVALGYGGVF